ncbi:hypothetical protein OOK58_42920 [Streptomyces sp. NBC_01728]|uniref:hypothetical protein n=1 Tax=unclassified Streptomyces TaxID=2593676 RepID=UPI002252315F|nr:MULTISPECIES: hypothetical protein [unclassified Streptomyces]MCX4458665.1 hypothetical protein [Streptomyces sp. NBC_01719]MCX4498022.1 hypothetical protein [Streptomyces sp. NBC_01728]
MACSCQKGNKARYEVVVTTDGKEKVVFSSGSKPTAETVGKRYAGSTIREVPAKNAAEKTAK